MAGYSPIRESITVAITQTGGNSNTWVADDNFILTGVAMNASASSDMVLSLDATPPGGTGLFQAANKSYRGTILAAARAITVNYNFPPMRVRIPKGARVTLANGSVNGGCAVLVLEKI